MTMPRHLSAMTTHFKGQRQVHPVCAQLGIYSAKSVFYTKTELIQEISICVHIQVNFGKCLVAVDARASSVMN